MKKNRQSRVVLIFMRRTWKNEVFHVRLMLAKSHNVWAIKNLRGLHIFENTQLSNTLYINDVKFYLTLAIIFNRFMVKKNN